MQNPLQPNQPHQCRVNLEGRFCLALKQGFQTPMFALGKNDTWGLTAAAICLVTWAVSLVDWACDCGLRVAAKAAAFWAAEYPVVTDRVTEIASLSWE